MVLSNIGKVFERVFGKRKKEEKIVEIEEISSKPSPVQETIYLKALPLRDLSDVEEMKSELKTGNILIVKVSPLAKKSVEDVKIAVNELYEYVQLIHGDIARLGEERIVMTPPPVRIWRERVPIEGRSTAA